MSSSQGSTLEGVGGGRRGAKRRGDQIFSVLTGGAALVVLVVTIGAGALFGMVGLTLAAPLTSAAVHIVDELREHAADVTPADPIPVPTG